MPLLLDRPYDSLLANFESSEETPYRDDDSVMPRKTILGDLHKVEDRYADLMFAAIERETKGLVTRSLESVRKGDTKAVENAPTYSANALSPILYSLWQEGWALGWQHAIKEVELLEKQSTFSDIAISGNVEFAELPEGAKRKGIPSWQKYIRRPKYPTYGEPVKMEDSAMRAAIEMRTVRVAQDLDGQARDEIRQHMRDATDSSNVLQKRISEKEMNRRIEVSLGRQLQREGSTREEVTQIQKSGGFKKRAKGIAVTEMMGSYSLARLSAFKAMGIRRVRWQTFEPPVDVCRTCWSRNGTVHNIDDLLGAGSRGLAGIKQNPTFPGGFGYDPRQYVIPSHPWCRCHWAPVSERDRDKIDDPGRDPRKRRAFPLKGVWAGVAAGALGLGALYLVLGQNVGTTLTKAQQMMARLNNVSKRVRTAIDPAIDPAIDVIAPELLDQAIKKAGRPGPGRELEAEPVEVGGVDLNQAAEKTLRSRFGLTKDQAQALEQSLVARPANDLSDLAERIRNGEIQGLDLETWEAQVMSRMPRGGVINVNDNPYGTRYLIEALRDVGISPRIARAIAQERYRGVFLDSANLIDRIGDRGIQVSPKNREILGKFLSFDTSNDQLKRSRGSGQAAQDNEIISKPDLLPDTVPSQGIIGRPATSDLFRSPTEWPFIGPMAPADERRSLESNYQKIKEKLQTVFPNYPDERGLPPDTRSLTKSMRANLFRINSLKGQIDLQTATVRVHADILKSYGYEVQAKSDPMTLKVQDIQLVEPEGGIQLSRSKQRRAQVALNNLATAHNKRFDLTVRLYDTVFALQRSDEALRMNLLRYGSADTSTPPITELPQPANLAPPETSQPSDLLSIPPTPPPTPEGTPATRQPDPESVENNYWQMQRDKLISEGSYNSSAAEYKMFDQQIKAAAPARIKAWAAIRKAEKIKGSKVDFARKQFPNMAQRDYREAARLIGGIEDALNKASSQQFAIAYSDALMGKSQSRYLIEEYPEFREFLAERYPTAATLDRLARNFGVTVRTPFYNPSYFSDYAGTRWYDVGREIEDEWRRKFRLGQLEEFPSPIALPSQIEAQRPKPIRPIQPESTPMTNISAPGPNLAFEPVDIETLDNLKDTIEALVGQRPKSLKEAHQLFDRFVRRNSTQYPDRVPYRIVDDTDEYDSDGVTMWDNLFDLGDGRFLAIPGHYDGGHQGDGVILPIAGLELFDYFFKRKGSGLKKIRRSESSAQADNPPPAESLPGPRLPAPSPKPMGEIDRSKFTAPGTPLKAYGVQAVIRDIEGAKTAVSSFAAQKRWAKMAGLIDARGNPTLEGAIAQELDPYWDSPKVTGAVMLINMARQEDSMGWLLQQIDQNPGGLTPRELAYEYNSDLSSAGIAKSVKAINLLFKAIDQNTSVNESPIGSLRLFEKGENGRLLRTEQEIKNPYLIAYALAKVWAEKGWKGSELHMSLDETRFSAMLGLNMRPGDPSFVGTALFRTLQRAEVFGLIEQRLAVPPFQIIPRWDSLEDLLRRAYEWEEKQGRQNFQNHSNLITFSRPTRWRKICG